MNYLDFFGSRRNVNPFFVDSNGVTIKLKQGFPGGITGKADGDTSGKIYTAASGSNFGTLLSNSADYSDICTTLITGLNQTFKSKDLSDKIFLNWDVSNVTSFLGTFLDSNINQNLNFWDVSRATEFNATFRGTPFNQPLDNWNPINGINFSAMFRFNNVMNQDISSWCVPNANIPSSFGGAFSPGFLPNWGAPC